jgi:hypothetical protein
MLLNIACFLAVCQPNDILLSSFGAAVADIILAFLFPAPSSDTKRISVVGEQFSFGITNLSASLPQSKVLTSNLTVSSKWTSPPQE